MAELQFEAPLAKFESDEWNEFNDFQTASDLENSNKTTGSVDNRIERESVDNFNETLSGSLEDLVNSFDEKITKCFKNYDEKVEKFAPVQIRSQEEIMNDCQMWWTITGNFGNILPIDWSKTYTRQLHTKALKLDEKRDCDSPDLDLSEDEELQHDFDLHSLIVSSLQQEPMFTAAEVIKEIEDMMLEGEDSGAALTPSDVDMLSPMSSELLHFKTNPDGTTENVEDIPSETAPPPSVQNEGLKNLSLGALNELYEELECAVKTYSETLINELALRDELEYEKELKNTFISLVLNVQRKKKDSQTEKKKNANSMKKVKGNNEAEPGAYLTTIVPYHAGMGTPTNEQLQIYIKLLQAILEDGPAVPGLLTDYILKVLCPT
ncbi:fasciculation and elongation protein zeta-2 isoform X2 [Lingula anatina]|uniref:Fasciculation and elongation protein zeta-2 isoform X2 n=1 Tax=Lingula anatina TaxID=7574 RepID=A0A1S3HLU6_LINAN|nr:fasciculation and elongation protein zeta-2 isoform X2 [Lingula anatina]|eukprot:XP_013385999.1 fasciculation and elongation protein zeta-2 isoform X2 [Lingula anatina]